MSSEIQTNVTRSKKRRSSSILKTQQYTSNDQVDAATEFTVTKSARRVSWAEKPYIKVFETAEAVSRVTHTDAGHIAFEEHSVAVSSMSLCSTFKEQPGFMTSCDENSMVNVPYAAACIASGAKPHLVDSIPGEVCSNGTNPETLPARTAAGEDDDETLNLVELLTKRPQTIDNRDDVQDVPMPAMLPVPNIQAPCNMDIEEAPIVKIPNLAFDRSPDDKSINLNILCKSISSTNCTLADEKAFKEAQRYENVNRIARENDMLREKIQEWKSNCEKLKTQLSQFELL